MAGLDLSGNLNDLMPSEKDGTSTSKSNTTGTSTSDTTGTSAGTSTSTNIYDANAKAALDKALGNTDFSKAAAIKDGTDAASWALQQSLQLGMPSISSASKSAGGYNSATTDMLNNDLTARSTASASSVILDTISKYSAANANNINASVNAVNATTGKNVVSSGTNTSSTKGTNTSTTDTSGTSTATSPGQAGGLGGAVSTIVGDAGKVIAKPVGTVICTQLYKDGHIPAAVFKADNAYVIKHFSTATRNGYKFWAIPLVAQMRKHPTIYSIVKFFGVHWSYHCAADSNRAYKSNLVGALLIAVAVPICYLIGCIVGSVDDSHLWAKE